LLMQILVHLVLDSVQHVTNTKHVLVNGRLHHMAKIDAGFVMSV